MREHDSLTLVVSRILVRLVVAQGVDRPVMVDLCYKCTDPYAVSLTFHVSADDTVRWVFGRDLLLNGQHGLTGAGDVQVWPSRCSWVKKTCIALRQSPNRDAVVVAASARTLDAFLLRTLEVVPAGTEDRHLDLDGTVHQLLGGPGEPRR
ncbi:SsgA family sporulation/cell division regulator [Streptomyces sp. NPDC002680]|uniref:SsgA family sporulation/cell division regulator n=1 Tax=Streptomyces sp. NPDC002680 TaxID=3364659 RepID=UPI00369F9B3B